MFTSYYHSTDKSCESDFVIMMTRRKNYHMAFKNNTIYQLTSNRQLDWFLIIHLKEQGHVTVNKSVISRIYIVAQMWPLCSVQIFVDGVNQL